MQSSSIKFLLFWTLCTALGCIIGMILAIVLSHALINPFHPEQTNVLVGACLGACVGFLQKLSIRERFALSWRWVWGAAAGFGLPFVLAFIIDKIDPELISFAADAEATFIWIALLGGILAGWLQKKDLQKGHKSAQWWILFSAAGWGISWLLNVLFPPFGYLIGVILMGIITGWGICWILALKTNAND
jgi:hypothetical protein